MDIMTTRAEEIYKKLKSAASIIGLIDECEDSHFDCKEWPIKDEDAQKMLAKAACGLTNAEGGVLVVGMKAESRPKDEPDVVTGTVLNLIGNLVEPGIVGVLVREITYPQGSKSGFVIVYVPSSEGAPRRSKKNWKFYQRIGAGTFPLEYFQIEDMFGKRPHPKLELVLEKVNIVPAAFSQIPQRSFRFALANVGRGVAKFPSVRFKRSCSLYPNNLFGLDGNGNHGLPLRASEGEWIIFRGGIDDVVYPGDTLAITFLVQDGKNLGKVGPEMHQGQWISNNPNEIRWCFNPGSFSCEISCEGIQTVPVDKFFDEEEHRQLIV
jgi:hypothetical protein